MKQLARGVAGLVLLATTALAGGYTCQNANGCKYNILVDGNWKERKIANGETLLPGDHTIELLGTGWVSV